MERLDQTRTVAAALAQLEAAGLDRALLCVKVDKLVNAYLAGFIVSARQTTAMRKILGDEFLAAAPLTELSYRIWRRIMREDTDLPEPVLHVASDQLLPDLDFSSRPAFIPQRTAAASKPASLAQKKPRSFFGLRR